VTAEEFIRRCWQHVLPSGLQKLRHDGFTHPCSKIDREWLKMFVAVTLQAVYLLIVGTLNRGAVCHGQRRSHQRRCGLGRALTVRARREKPTLSIR
jgi:hypothetical protein